MERELLAQTSVPKRRAGLESAGRPKKQRVHRFPEDALPPLEIVEDSENEEPNSKQEEKRTEDQETNTMEKDGQPPIKE